MARWWQKRREKDKNAFFGTYKDLLALSYTQTPCEIHPTECLPRPIKHVVWDADDTIWDIEPEGIASLVNPPFEKIKEGTLELQQDAEAKAKSAWKVPGIIQLREGLIETLEELEQRGIGSSIASTNAPGSVERIIEALGMRDRFTRIKSNFSTKTEMIKEITAEVGVRPDEIIFVDDNIYNVFSTFKSLNTLSLHLGTDIQHPSEILKYIKEK